jgi:hypothetical protein
MRRRRYDDDDVIQDGQGVYVRVDLADAAVNRFMRDAAAVERRMIADAVARDARIFSGHRPGPVADGLSRAFMTDARLDLARAMRADALARLEQRSRDAWRLGDAVARPLNSMPPAGPDEPDYDNGNGDLEDARRAAYESQYRPMRDQPWNSNRNLSGQNSGVLDPTRASAIQAQGMRWRHGA